MLQIGVERAAQEVAILSPKPALVDPRDLFFILGADFVLRDPHSAYVSNGKVQNIWSLRLDRLRVPRVGDTGYVSLAGIDVPETGQYHGNLSDERSVIGVTSSEDQPVMV